MENIKVGDEIQIEFTICNPLTKNKRIPKIETCKVLKYQGQLAVILKTQEVNTRISTFVYFPLSLLKISKHIPK